MERSRIANRFNPHNPDYRCILSEPSGMHHQRKRSHLVLWLVTLLPKLGEVVTTEEQKEAQNALKHLLQVLKTKPFLVQIDSLEMLLEGNEQQGWSAFSDGL